MDRNHWIGSAYLMVARSLSARRAWIEMIRWPALSGCRMSLSARRAWIEIRAQALSVTGSEVALRKESVDRNMSSKATRISVMGRSPQGERG